MWEVGGFGRWGMEEVLGCLMEEGMGSGGCGGWCWEIGRRLSGGGLGVGVVGLCGVGRGGGV